MSGSEAAGIRRRPIAVVATAIAAAAILATGLAISRSPAAGLDAAPSPQATGYLPSISDLMIATIQPRHERLWRAAQNGNWEFAAYELGNLHGAFDRLGLAHPIEHDISFPEMIASVTEAPFKELNSAIQSKDGTAFARAYADLTDACNSCHQALNHGVVDIRVPNRTSASDLNADSTSRN
ncbi:MAG TPA: cytochrome family protein [Xanthobacteraceae bacterium]|nr:cytochrome family protein [Xanthobacteraceae bacterium]